ncbi:hypothetical protein PIB30_003226 [Stylosanthes scabra]|uniref:Uncharacterized protein n=1 Tax=Stylosanthes scabra TaxID=79078 RepID=A0ABU6Q363_9FABA|nr:hypothetical protein [Stylosanthes scabra]
MLTEAIPKGCLNQQNLSGQNVNMLHFVLICQSFSELDLAYLDDSVIQESHVSSIKIEQVFPKDVHRKSNEIATSSNNPAKKSIYKESPRKKMKTKIFNDVNLHRSKISRVSNLPSQSRRVSIQTPNSQHSEARSSYRKSRAKSSSSHPKSIYQLLLAEL